MGGNVGGAVVGFLSGVLRCLLPPPRKSRSNYKLYNLEEAETWRVAQVATSGVCVLKSGL